MTKSSKLYWLIHCTFFHCDEAMEISKSLPWIRWICDEKKMVNNLNFSNFLLKKIKKTNIFLQKSRLFWPKIEKNPKNSKNKANIDNAMNVSFSLRWIFIARIFFTAMNSLLVSRCTYYLLDILFSKGKSCFV